MNEDEAFDLADDVVDGMAVGVGTRPEAVRVALIAQLQGRDTRYSETPGAHLVFAEEEEEETHE